LIFLSKATANSDLHSRIEFFNWCQETEISIQLVIRIFTNSARIEDNNVCLLTGLNWDESSLI
jgi:hypothetical protein